MTTNQTIDGVPRELLERCARELSIGIGPAPKNRAQELRALLRALLDAERCSSCDDSGDLTDLTGEWRGYCICPIGVALKNRPAAQPQGEPVAWGFVNEDGEPDATARWDVAKYLPGDVKPLYAEQPAPVAAVHTMKSVMEANCSIIGAPVLTSNHCAALAAALNAGEAK